MGQRDEGQDGCQCGQDHGSGTLHGCLDNRMEWRQSRLLVMADLSNQDQRVAHQETRQCNQADQRIDAERLAPNKIRVGTTPIRPSGLVRKTMTIAEIERT